MPMIVTCFNRPDDTQQPNQEKEQRISDKLENGELRQMDASALLKHSHRSRDAASKSRGQLTKEEHQINAFNNDPGLICLQPELTLRHSEFLCSHRITPEDCSDRQLIEIPDGMRPLSGISFGLVGLGYRAMTSILEGVRSLCSEILASGPVS
jgi:hypothetical protein